jgi:surfactin synthase thioesterase subunit
MSSIGIFRPTAGNGLSFRFRKWQTAKPPKVDTRQAELRARIDQVAEAFADGADTLVEVERLTGIPRRTVGRLWDTIKQEMGAQAV